MWIIDNGPDQRNFVTDPLNGYASVIGIEIPFFALDIMSGTFYIQTKILDFELVQ